jgi:hypothetical protein
MQYDVDGRDEPGHDDGGAARVTRMERSEIRDYQTTHSSPPSPLIPLHCPLCVRPFAACKVIVLSWWNQHAVTLLTASSGFLRVRQLQEWRTDAQDNSSRRIHRRKLRRTRSRDPGIVTDTVNQRRPDRADPGP